MINKPVIVGQPTTRLEDFPREKPPISDPAALDRWWMDVREVFRRSLNSIESRVSRLDTGDIGSLSEQVAALQESVDALQTSYAPIDLTSIQAQIEAIEGALSILSSESVPSISGSFTGNHFLYDWTGSWAFSGSTHLIATLVSGSTGKLVAGIGWDTSLNFSEPGEIAINGRIQGATIYLRVGKLGTSGLPDASLVGPISSRGFEIKITPSGAATIQWHTGSATTSLIAIGTISNSFSISVSWDGAGHAVARCNGATKSHAGITGSTGSKRSIAFEANISTASSGGVELIMRNINLRN